MKKFIFILAIAVIAMGSVFADGPAGNAQIKIQTEITEGLPAFRLDTVQVTALVGETEKTHTITTDALLANDQTVAFTIKQVADSRTTKNYTLTVTATDLEAIRPTDVDVDDWAGIPEAQRKFVVDGTTPAVTAETVTGINLSATGNVLTADYIGQLVEATTTPIAIGTFSCKWAKQPKAAVAVYEATVTLTIAAI